MYIEYFMIRRLDWEAKATSETLASDPHHRGLSFISLPGNNGSCRRRTDYLLVRTG